MGNSHTGDVNWRNRWNIDWLYAGSGLFAESKFLSLPLETNEALIKAF